MILLDAGFYAGKALEQYIDRGIVDDTWTVYAFEPNPDIDIEKQVERFNLPVDIIKKAVWIKDGKVKFQIGGRDDSASIQGTTGHTTPKIVKVPSIDFSKFVSKLPDVYTICSMDIEGSEFRVLEKMLKEHTIDKIDFLDIEFHHRFMNGYSPEDAEELIKQIKSRGVKVKLKVELR